MRLESKKYLFDILSAAELLIEFTAGKNFSDYEHDAMLRAAVERKFEIMGEALNQLAKIDEPTAERISEYKRIIGFRNALIRGYFDVNDSVVWDVLQKDLPVVHREAEEMLAED